MLNYIDLEKLNARLEADAHSFSNAVPFKHISFDDILLSEKIGELKSAYPDENWEGWGSRDHEHQRKKMSCRDSALIPEPLNRLIFELNSGPFIIWLEKLTGISNILPDPHLSGGGLHMTLPGGWLTPHTDFHELEGRRLYRRLNLLIYFNENWQESNNGQLELWNRGKDEIEFKIPPELGRCVIFQTDDDSVHGFSTPVADKPRCSVALYYYTPTEDSKFSGDGNTYWRVETLEGKNTVDAVRLWLQKSLLGFARICSALSWRASKASYALTKK